MAAVSGQAFTDRELYTVCKTLLAKFEEVKSGKKVSITTELKSAVRLILYGAKPESLHPNFKKTIFEFLCHLTTFSDVLAAQSGINHRNKLLIVLFLKLSYTNISELPPDLKWKRMFGLIYSIIQRNLEDMSVKAPLLNSITFPALEPQSGIPRQAILKLPHTLNKGSPWKFEQAGDISKYLCQWLLVYTTQNPGSSGKKSLFQNKSPNVSQTTTAVMEIDGSPCRDIFTVLNISKNYIKEHMLNIYTFAVLKSWLEFALSQEDMTDCLTSTLPKFPTTKGTPKGVSYSDSPLSAFGASQFYDVDSESSTESPSVSSSFASSPVFSQFDELTNEQFDRRRTFDQMSLRSATPSFIATPRKTSQAFDTVSITSDIFSNASNLKNVAAKYCLRIILQSERGPLKDTDRAMVTASVVEAIQILDLLCKEECTFTQKVFNEIKKLYRRLEEKPVAARRVLVALVQFYINHHEEMMIQVEEILEIYFKNIPKHLYTSQTTGFEIYELCLKNKEFFKFHPEVLVKYVPNLFRFAAWWPCSFMEEICEILSLILNRSTAAEILHLILDLPCLAALLQLSHDGFIEDPVKLGERLKTDLPPYSKALFNFILRDKLMGVETIDKIPELHRLLGEFSSDPLVKYVTDILPPLLVTYMSIIEELDSEEVYKKIFPILIERTYQLFPVDAEHSKILEIFGTEIKSIAEWYPEVISLHSGEIISFLTLFRNSTSVQKSSNIVNAVLHAIGDSVSAIDNAILSSFYDTIEELAYEALNGMNSNKEYILSSMEILQSLLATISKIAAHAQEHIQRAVVCLNKVVSFVADSPLFVNLKSYAQELTNMLNRPQVAPAILCKRSGVVPWHLTGDSSLMLKIHVLSQ